MSLRTSPDRYLFPLLGIGLILSPLNLAALGNAAGLTGSFFPLALISVLAVHLLTAHSYQALISSEPGEKRKRVPGPFGTAPLLILLFGSRISLALSAIPLFLVSAGFIFNELFLYWFPNFAFAYGMLVFFLLLNLLGEKAVLRAQTLLVACALGGLLVISMYGLWSAFFSPETATSHDFGSGPSSFLGIAMVLMLFIGFDLDGPNRFRRKRPFHQHPFQMSIILLSAGLSFLLWGMVSLLFVSAPNLVETTVAHIAAARAILGEPGARIMGVIVLAGAGASVNALFFSVPRLLTFPLDLRSDSPSADPSKKPVAFFLITLGALVALVLALGLAGESELEKALKAALLLWLTQNAWIHLLALIQNRQDRAANRFSRMVPLAGLVLLTGSLIWMVLEENQKSLVLLLYLAFLLISWSLSFIMAKCKTNMKEVKR